MDYASVRKNMVESQIRTCDVTDPRLIAALSLLPREAFLPAKLRDIAYIDRNIPFSHEEGGAKRYLSAPMGFAKLVQLCDIKRHELVLEIGTGCGYGAAVLAKLADAVISLERDPALVAQATENLIAQDIDNAAVVEGPLADGYRAEGPYDAIIVSGSVPAVPEKFFDQIKPAGRLVAVIGTPTSGRAHIIPKDGAAAGGRIAFDCTMAPLPGFETDPGFVF